MIAGTVAAARGFDRGTAGRPVDFLPRAGAAALCFVALALGVATPARAQIVFDPHVDLPASAASPSWTGTRDAASQFDVERARRGGVTAIGLALFVPQGYENAKAEARWSISARYAALQRLLAANQDTVTLARSPADVRAAAGQGKLAIVPTILNAWPLGDDPGAFDAWYAQGVRIVGFVHAGHNQFADSSRPALARGERADQQGGLTPLGRAAVARLNDLGVLVDVSQLSDKAFDQVLALSRAPVVATHSDVRALVDNPRNLSDAQLDAIAAKGGVVAINAFSAYLHPDSAATEAAIAALQRDYGITPHTSRVLSPADQAAYTKRYYAIRGREPKATLAELIAAVDHAVKRIGVDHVALSSDFNHGGGIVGWADVGETANVAAALRQHGYKDADIAKLWGGNLLRVWQAAIDAGKRP